MTNSITTIVAVPARLESSRLPNKVLADVGGKSMLQRVLERCSAAKSPVAVILCTDSEVLLDLASTLGFPALLTRKDCQSGSERIASVSKEIIEIAMKNNTNMMGFDLNIDPSKYLIINVQGDQPFIDPNVIDNMHKVFTSKNPIPSVMTPVYRLGDDKIHNPNVVKTLLAKDGRAIYFSRSALPHVRGIPMKDWPQKTTFWGHVGIYGYRADVLQNWSKLPYSPLENIEKLEQLRLIEAGIEIDTFTVEGESLSVDTQEQLEHARNLAISLD